MLYSRITVSITFLALIKNIMALNVMSNARDYLTLFIVLVQVSNEQMI